MADKKTSDASPQARLEELEKELDGLATSLQRGARLTLILTVLLLAVVTGYFVYGYNQFSALLQPGEIVDAAGGILDDNLSVARVTLEQEITRSAPIWAEQLSQQVIAGIPTLRGKMQTYILTQSETALEKMQMTTQGQFRNALKGHREEFAALAQELATNEVASDKIMEGVRTALEQELGVGMQRDAGELLAAIKTANVRLDELATGKKLSADQRLERDALMLVRRIQLQEPLPEVPVVGAPLQGLVDRLKEEAKQSEEADDDTAPTRAEASMPPANGGGDEAEADASAANAEQVRSDMAEVASQARALTSELATAVAAADSAANDARSAAETAQKETAAAAAATAELREAIAAARAALEKVRAAGKAAENEANKNEANKNDKTNKDEEANKDDGSGR